MRAILESDARSRKVWPDRGERLALDQCQKSRAGNRPRYTDIHAPQITQTDSGADISYLLLGDRADPMIPVNLFRTYVRPALGKGADEFFETLSYINKIKFWQLYNLCSRYNGSMVDKIKLACQFQLEALDYAWFGNWVPNEVE